MMDTRIAVLSLIVLLPGCSWVDKTFVHRPDRPSAAFMGLPLLVDEEFDRVSPRWEVSDRKAWQYTHDGSRTVLALVRNSNYKPPFRSPTGLAILKDVAVSDFILDAWLRSTKFDYPHRDMCLFFDYQDTAHFYYVHFGLKSDDSSNTIHVVNNADRRPIVKTRTAGSPWTEGYHHVRVIRRAASGEIEAYFDDMSRPAMTARDKTFTWGRIGVGSFDDIGNVDRVILWGRKVKPPTTRTVSP
jgi:hypothetical protein